MTKKSTLYSLLFTIFNDAIGWGIVLTIFAPLLFAKENGLLPVDTSNAARNLILGVLISSYAVTQFFSMPIIGALSDHFGRKRLLEWTILGACMSFVLSAIAILANSLALVFVARLLAGIFSGNAGIAQASIADLSTEKTKMKNLSLAGVVGGISWIVGPPMGGFLSEPRWVSWFNFSTPFWFLALLFGVNWLWVRRGFIDTFVKKGERHDWKQEIRDLSKLSKIPRMKGWLIAGFLFFFGWFFFVLYYPTLFVQKFHFDQGQIGLFSAYLSIFWFIASLSMNRWLGERLKPEKVLLTAFPVIGVFLLIAAIEGGIGGWIGTFPFLALAASSAWVGVMAVTSNLAGKENQGKIFGITASLLSLAVFFAPLCSGILASLNINIPIYLGITVFAALSVFTWKLCKRA